MSLSARILALLIAGIVLAGTSFSAGIRWQRGQQAIDTAEATREARATEARRNQGVHDAQAAATRRANTARADADRARTELERLRDEIAAGGVPGESTAACAARADAAAELLAQCAGAYRGLAETADGLNGDRLMLIEAWPK